jgi:threonine aldolase
MRGKRKMAQVNTSAKNPSFGRPEERSFASDNYAGAHPEVLDAIVAASAGHAPAYGDDAWTEKLGEVMRGHFGHAAQTFPVFNGTGANVIALQSALPRWGAVVCAESAHINVDENGAPERVGGLKLLTVPTPDGKLTPELIDRQAWGFGDPHRAQPLAVSITQTTEFGTCYSVDEIRAISEHAHGLGMIVHLDGARISNAAAQLGQPLAAFTTDAGIDLVSLGGTKNGLIGAEAVVALREGVAPGFEYVRKMNMQLGSKMRFLSAQLLALYDGDLWLRSAAHANAMATRLRAGIDALEPHGISAFRATEANAVFATLPAGVADLLRGDTQPEGPFHFYDWPGVPGSVRLMCAFDTTPDAVDALLAGLRRAVAT